MVRFMLRFRVKVHIKRRERIPQIGNDAWRREGSSDPIDASSIRLNVSCLSSFCFLAPKVSQSCGEGEGGGGGPSTLTLVRSPLSIASMRSKYSLRLVPEREVSVSSMTPPQTPSSPAFGEKRLIGPLELTSLV
jgi:hypothetical protein